MKRVNHKQEKSLTLYFHFLSTSEISAAPRGGFRVNNIQSENGGKIFHIQALNRCHMPGMVISLLN